MRALSTASLTRNTAFHRFYLWVFLPLRSISWRQKVVYFLKKKTINPFAICFD